jgi:hypothetical protein
VASPLSTYYDLMVGRLTKPVVLYCAVIGAWLGTQDPADAPLGVHRLRLLGGFATTPRGLVRAVTIARTGHVPCALQHHRRAERDRW